MDQSRPPERLDFTNPNWQAWRSAFQTYRAVSQLDREEQHTQVSTLLYCMGSQAQQISKTFNKNIDDDVCSKTNNMAGNPTVFPYTYEEMLCHFDSHFTKPKVNVVRCRREFLARRQLGTEEETAFYKALVEAAVNCEFTDKSERILDQFVSGLRSVEMMKELERLYISSPLDFTLDKVLEWTKTRQSEMKKINDKNQRTPMTETFSNSTVNECAGAINSKKGFVGNKSSNMNITTAPEDGGKFQSTKPKKLLTAKSSNDILYNSVLRNEAVKIPLCIHCGSNTHSFLDRKCPAFSSTCAICSIPNHLHSKPCRQSRSAKASSSRPLSSHQIGFLPHYHGNQIPNYLLGNSDGRPTRHSTIVTSSSRSNENSL